MPGVQAAQRRPPVDVAEECVSLGIPVMALFPVIDPALKTPDGRGPPTWTAWCPAVVASSRVTSPSSAC